MSINEMIDLINESSSDADTDESDATVDNLELPQPEEHVPEDLATFVEKYDKIPEKKRMEIRNLRTRRSSEARDEKN
jgi:hypothetical protein